MKIYSVFPWKPTHDDPRTPEQIHNAGKLDSVIEGVVQREDATCHKLHELSKVAAVEDGGSGLFVHREGGKAWKLVAKRYQGG